jgi:hypothetical protein
MMTIHMPTVEPREEGPRGMTFDDGHRGGLPYDETGEGHDDNDNTHADR